MAKKKSRARRKAPPRPAQRLLQGLAEAEDLMEQKRWADARQRLEELVQRYPAQPELLHALLDVYHELNDMEAYQEVAEQLVRLEPDDPDLALALAGAYLIGGRLLHAARAFERFLERWPDHPEAAETRQMAALLEKELPQALSELPVPAEEAREVGLLAEQMQSDLARGRFAEVRRVAEALLRRHPHFPAAYNNVSLVQWLEGKLAEAIATAQRVLEFEPGNIHALSNLIHFLCSAGRTGEAATYAERLKAAEAKGSEPWLKKAEGLSFFGDDAGVVQVLQQAERKRAYGAPATEAMLRHLGAAAALRLGREAEARRQWQQVLKLMPEFDLAEENLADLKRPVDEREGPWAFHLAQWVSPATLRGLSEIPRGRGRRRSGEAMAQALRRYLEQHPELVGVVPLLLDRGDPEGRSFALELARLAATPALLEALRDFALGQRGSDRARLRAVHTARDAGLLPSGPLRLWVDGQWRELLLMDFEVHGEPTTTHSPAVASLVEEALPALRDGDGERAEALFRQALALEPEAPDLQHNLAMALGAQGRTREAEALVRDVRERHPDYLFTRVSAAKLAIRRGDLDGARQELAPLRQRQSFHYSEFDALAGAEIELLLAQGNLDAARSWLNTWESLDPDNPKLEHYRKLIERPARRGGRLAKLLRR